MKKHLQLRSEREYLTLETVPDIMAIDITVADDGFGTARVSLTEAIEIRDWLSDVLGSYYKVRKNGRTVALFFSIPEAEAFAASIGGVIA